MIGAGAGPRRWCSTGGRGNSGALRFGDYLFDPERYELHRAGVLVPLRPEECDVLAYLLTHRDRVVSKDELLDQVWPGQFVGDATLHVHSLSARLLAMGTTARRDSSARCVLHGKLLRECFGMPGLASVVSRSFLTLSLAECGAFAEGRALAEEGVRIAEAADHPYSRVQAYTAVGFRALRQGNCQQAIPMIERAIDLAQGAHIRLLVPRVATLMGAAYTLAGRTIDALPLLEQAVEQAVAMRFMLEHALQVALLSEAYLLAGRLDEAYTQAQHALEFSRAHQERGHEAYALRLLGEFHVRRDPPEVEPAETHYRQALTLAEALGMRARSRPTATVASAPCIAREDG